MIIHGAPEEECVIEEDPELGSMFHTCGKARAECVRPGECPNGDCETKNRFFPATTCAELEMSIQLPDCWDGVSLDSDNHRDHVSYEDEDTELCPPTHPTRIPRVT